MRDPARGARLVPASSPRRRQVGASRLRQFLPRARNRTAAVGVRRRGTEIAPPARVRILHVGNAHLVEPLRALGHEVIAAFEEYPALAAAGVPFDVRVLWRCLPAPPDLLLVADMLGPQALPFGLEDVPAPRLYYAIDVHVNFFWQRHYARLFDLVLVAQKDYVPLFAAAGVPARWLPWGADERVFHERGLRRVHDLVFVGTVDPATRPKRAAVVECLRRRFGLATNGAQAVRERHTLRARMAALSAAVEAGIVRRDVAADVPLAWGMTAHLAAVRGLASAAVTVPAAAKSLRAAADAGEAEAAVALAE